MNECNSEPPNRLRICLNLRKMVRSVSHERVKQRAAEQIEDAPQSPAEVVEAVTLVPRERAHEKLGVYFRAWTRVNARWWKARVRSGMLPRPL